MAPLALAARPSLGATLERLAGRGIQHLDLSLRDGPPAEAGWRAPAELLDPATLGARLARVAVEAGCADPRVAGTFLLEGYVNGLATPALGAYLAEGRIPDVGPRAVAVRLGEGADLAGVAFLAPRFGLLAAGQEAADPAALPFASDAELLAWFRRRLVRHLTPLVGALAPRTRRAPRALWASVEDVLSGVLCRLGQGLGCAERARDRAGLLLGVEEPLAGRPRFRTLVHPGGAHTYRARSGCCQYFRTPAAGAGPAACFSCARTDDAERVRRLSERR